MDNEYDQSKVAYENGPKEVNTAEPMPGSKDQFGKGDRMPQDKAMKHHAKKTHMTHGRHKEHR